MGAERYILFASQRSNFGALQMTKLADEDRFLTPAEASEFLRRGVRTLARMRAEGRGPAYHRMGGKVLYPLSSLRSFMDSGMVVPAGGIS